MESIDKGLGAFQITKQDVLTEATDLFGTYQHDISVQRSHEVVVKPLHLNDDGPWDFQFPAQGSHYVNLPSARMYLKGKVTNSDNSDLASTGSDIDTVALTNLAISTFFRDVEIEIEGKSITALNVTNFHYVNYLQHLFTYSKHSEETHLRSSGFVMDKADKFESLTTAENPGFGSRQQSADGFELFGPLGLDFMASEKYFPPGFSFVLRFHRAPDSFSLMSVAGKNYKIHFEKAEIHIRYLELHPKLKEAHITRFKTHPVTLNINRTQIRTFAFGPNQSDMYVPNAITGNMPKSIIIGIVDQAAYNGQYDKNPYNFKHNNLTQASLRVNGKEMPTTAYTPNFSKNLIIREYKTLFDNTGIKNSDYANMITYDLFKGGCTLISFDLTPDACSGDHLHPPENGTISIDFKFGSPLAVAKCMIVQAVYDCVVVIDPNFNLSVVD